jgi:hypothetical protein
MDFAGNFAASAAAACKVAMFGVGIFVPFDVSRETMSTSKDTASRSNVKRDSQMTCYFLGEFVLTTLGSLINYLRLGTGVKMRFNRENAKAVPVHQRRNAAPVLDQQRAGAAFAFSRRHNLKIAARAAAETSPAVPARPWWSRIWRAIGWTR